VDGDLAVRTEVISSHEILIRNILDTRPSRIDL